jgi:eukaryotic-like serine/threonine-protein kinase
MRKLGEGGMGAVYDVTRTTDARRLALKVISGVHSGATAARFAREAEIGARVRHENLTSIVDVGVARGGAPFLVMELVEGGSLEERRSRFGDLPWALSLLGQIAGGLAALHTDGVVHRDLKPANILLTTAGVPKIADFGISRIGVGSSETTMDARASALIASLTELDKLTGTGALLGTPLYMAPEAAREGGALDSAADIFALGILAYEMLTGSAPFSLPPIVRALRGQPIPSPAPIHGSLVEPRVAECIMACLAPEPERRPTARAVLERMAEPV